MNLAKIIFGLAIATLVLAVLKLVHLTLNFDYKFSMPDFSNFLNNTKNTVVEKFNSDERQTVNNNNISEHRIIVHNDNENTIELNKNTQNNIVEEKFDNIKTDENLTPQNEIVPNSKYKLVQITEPMSPEDCIKYKDKLGIINCTKQPDYWAKAIQMCGGKNKMANDNDLVLIANDIYETNILGARNSNSYGLDLNIKTARKYFGNNNVRGVWSANESTGQYVGCSHWRYFWGTSTGWRGNGNRSSLKDASYALCK